MEPMPEGVRTARAAKGWSQNRLVYEIQLYAQSHAIAVASTASLRVYVSEWENGRRAVSAPYAGILRALFGLTDSELFGRPEPRSYAVEGYADLVSRIDAARSGRPWTSVPPSGRGGATNWPNRRPARRSGRSTWLTRWASKPTS